MKILERHVARLSARRQVLFASNSHAILLVFQAMDAAGKDGAIRHVMSGVKAFWSAYMMAYEECINRTSTRASPWYVVPADDKKNARLIVSHIVLDALRELKLKYPRVDAGQRETLQAIRRRLQE